MTNKIRFLATFFVMLLTQTPTLCMVNSPTKAAIDNHLKQLFVHYQLEKKVGTTTYEKLNSILSLEWCTCPHATRNSREILLTSIVHTITQQFKPTDKLVITSFGAGSLLFEFFLCKLLEHYNFKNIQLNYIELDAYKNDSAHQNFKNNLAHIELKRINFSERKTTPKSDIFIMIDPEPNFSDLEDFNNRIISNLESLTKNTRHINYFTLAKINRCFDRRGHIIFLTPSYFLEQNLPLSFPLIFYKKNVPDHDRKKMIEDIIQAHREFSTFEKNNIAYIDNIIFTNMLNDLDSKKNVPTRQHNSFFTQAYKEKNQRLIDTILNYTSKYNKNPDEVCCYVSMPMMFQELIEFSQQASGSYFFSLNNDQIQSGSTKKHKPFIAQFYEMQGWKPLSLMEPNQLTEKITALKTGLEALKFKLKELRKNLTKLKKKLVPSHS